MGLLMLVSTLDGAKVTKIVVKCYSRIPEFQFTNGKR